MGRYFFCPVMDMIQFQGQDTGDCFAAKHLDFIMVPVHLYRYGAVLFGINTTIKYLVILIETG